MSVYDFALGSLNRLPEEDELEMELAQRQDEGWDPGIYSRLLEGFSRGYTGPSVRPRGFGANFVSGLAGGLAAGGQKVAQERQAIQERMRERQRMLDVERIQKSRERREEERDIRAEGRKRPSAPDLGPYGVYVTPQGRQIMRAGEAAAGGFLPYEKPEKEKQEELLAIETEQGPVYVPRSQAVGKRPAVGQPKAARVTGADRQALAYYNRGKQALETIAIPDRFGKSLEQRVAESGIIGQAGLQYAPNLFKSPEQRAYRQAQRAFTEARLRKESGAAVPKHEYEADAMTYFAQPGDDAETLEQKRIAREKVLEGIGYAAGPAYEEFYGEPFPAAARVAPGTSQSRTRPSAAPHRDSRPPLESFWR